MHETLYNISRGSPLAPAWGRPRAYTPLMTPVVFWSIRCNSIFVHCVRPSYIPDRPFVLS